MALVRHSLMLVGPPGVGKSKIVEVLHDAVSAAPAGENQPPLFSLSMTRPVLLVEGSGTAKTSSVLQVLAQQDHVTCHYS